MSNAKDSKALLHLAASIESDIRNRGLAQGDRYLPARNVAELFGISPATCHRAMRLLADREVLTRRRNSGTFVGPKMGPVPMTLVRSVYVLLSRDRRWGNLPRGDVMDGLWRKLPDVDLHFAILPEGNEVRYVEELLSNASSAGQLLGVVAVSCSRGVYDYLVCHRTPAVVIGSVDPEDERLASVDADQRHAGHLLAECMLNRGFRQFVVLMPELWRRGDNLFLEGVRDTLDKQGLSVGALRVHSLPSVPRIAQDQVASLLASSTGPIALISWDVSVVPCIDAVRQARPDLWQSGVGVAFHDDAGIRDPNSAYPFTFPRVSVLDMSEMVGQMIVQLNAGDVLPQRHVLLPMALRDSQASGNGAP